MNEQRQFWAGQFGDEYTKRNRVDWRRRIPFWQNVIDLTGARSVHEVGCNAGWNLSAIRRAFPDINISGNDINESALSQAESAGLPVELGDEISFPSDLVFTAGVLIHVSPDDLPGLMRRIVDASYRYVLAVEYADEQEVEIEYRGHAGKLWRRPFGRMYQDMGLKLVAKWPAGDGFDNCTAWLLEK